MNRSIALLLLTLSACAATDTQDAPAANRRSDAPREATADDIQSLRLELKKLSGAVSLLQEQVAQLESIPAAASADNEFKELVIDSAHWARPGEMGNAGVTGQLLCHPRDWRGFGKLKRFTQLADLSFELEAEGRQPVNAYMSTGGISSADGSTHFTILNVSEALAPGVIYRLRPLNQKEDYRWVVDERIRITAQ